MDCDKEGENICFEVIEAVGMTYSPNSGSGKGGSGRKSDQQIYRAKFSSITDKDIRAAMKNLGEPDENQSKR